MIRVRFYNPITGIAYSEARAKSADIGFKLNQTADWKVSILRTAMPLSVLESGVVAADVYVNGDFIVGGMCQLVPDKGSGLVEVNGRQWIDKLYDDKAYSQAVYKNQPILLVLALLLKRQNWRLGDISTVIDKTKVITIDLRQAQQLLNQITTVVEGIPGLFYRYGGFLVGKHALDLGQFSAATFLKLLQPATPDQPVEDNTGWISGFERELDQTDIYYEVEAFGGDVMVSAAVTRAVNLGDALAANPALGTDPDFPIIIEIPGFIWKVRNNAVDPLRGARTLQRQTQFAPERSGSAATAGDIQNAGLALYSWVVAFMKDHQKNTTNIKADAFGNNSLLVPVGDSVYLRYSQQINVWNPLLETMDEDVLVVEGDFRNVGYTLSVDENGKIAWSYSLTDGDTVTQEDMFVSLYDTVQQDAPPAGAVFVPSFAPVIGTSSAVLSGGLPDTIMSDGTPGKLLTIPLPSVPGSPDDLLPAGIPYPTAFSPAIKPHIELVQDPFWHTPGTGSLPCIVRVSINGSWEPSFSTTLEMKVVWM